jgi:hypothetical protein
MNRCDFIDIVFNAGFKPTKEQSKEMLNFACAKGRDVIFEKYISKGFEPTLDDFVSAVDADCLPIVRFFVEKKFYDVNNVIIAKTAHGAVKNYLVDRGMQLPSKQVEEKYHKAAK